MHVSAQKKYFQLLRRAGVRSFGTKVHETAILESQALKIQIKMLETEFNSMKSDHLQWNNSLYKRMGVLEEKISQLKHVICPIVTCEENNRMMQPVSFDYDLEAVFNEEIMLDYGAYYGDDCGYESTMEVGS